MNTDARGIDSGAAGETLAARPAGQEPEPSPEMLEAFQRGFQEQLRIRDKARFKPDPTPREQMSAEKAGLLAMLKVASAAAVVGRPASLLRSPLRPGEKLVCYCPPGICQAPKGFSGPCNRAADHAKTSPGMQYAAALSMAVTSEWVRGFDAAVESCASPAAAGAQEPDARAAIIAKCERESGTCVEVHSRGRHDPCTPENCASMAAGAQEGSCIRKICADFVDADVALERWPESALAKTRAARAAALLSALRDDANPPAAQAAPQAETPAGVEIGAAGAD
jgi:hypothetical protein